jgi:DNA-binding CsgD family transcriptional regulator
LSSSTVNNHLGVIFKKLAVSNKVQLLHAMKLKGTAV